MNTTPPIARNGTRQHEAPHEGPRRHPRRGGYARGEETRARIVATALLAFGEQGYDHTSTRQIAASAGVNPPALQYYFDSKQGLYRACVQTIIDRVREVLAPAMQQAQAALSAESRDTALEALLGLLDALADALVAAGAEGWSRFIARGKTDDAGPAMTMMRERISTPLRQALCELIGVIVRRSPQSEEVRLRALTIMGQVSMCHANREGTLAALGWQQFDARGIAAMKAVVRAHTRAALLSVIPAVGSAGSANVSPAAGHAATAAISRASARTRRRRR